MTGPEITLVVGGIGAGIGAMFAAVAPIIRATTEMIVVLRTVHAGQVALSTVVKDVHIGQAAISDEVKDVHVLVNKNFTDQRTIIVDLQARLDSLIAAAAVAEIARAGLASEAALALRPVSVPVPGPPGPQGEAGPQGEPGARGPGLFGGKG